MEFCPTCGCRLEPRKNDGTGFMLCCTKCNFTKQPADRKTEARTGAVIQPKAKPFMTIISEEDQKIKTMQTIKMKCEKCEKGVRHFCETMKRKKPDLTPLLR